MLAIFNKFNGNSKLYKFYSYKILLTLTLKIYHIFSKQVIGFSERKCFNCRAFFCRKQVIQIGAQVIPTRTFLIHRCLCTPYSLYGNALLIPVTWKDFEVVQHYFDKKNITLSLKWQFTNMVSSIASVTRALKKLL